MRMLMLSLAILAVMIMSGCSSPNWEVAIQAPTKFQEGVPSQLLLEISGNGKPATGLQVHGILEMARMDHGTIEVDFKETGNGQYESTAELPMNGEWNAILEISNGKTKAEKTVNFNVE
ncbi:FixH family protein [Schinkia sp. CFF1]